MIPPDWTPVHRPHDDELVGYLAPDVAGTVPVSACGMPLGPAGPRARAVELLIEVGLAALDRRYWCLLPELLPPGDLPLSDLTGTEWRAVVLVEVSPDRTVLRPEWPPPEERTSRVVLPTPVEDRLRFDPPPS